MRLLLSISLLATFSVSTATNANLVHLLGAQGVNLLHLDQASVKSSVGLVVQNSDNVQLLDPLPGYWFEQPLDHFSNDSYTFRQRYWLNTRYYQPGSAAPVIVLDGGETSGEDRIPFLDKGIVDILAKATGGVGVVLEHRYYGRSIPVSNFSTDSLRWLNNAQSAADSAHFMANVRFPGIDEDLTAPNTPWIYYGGSYAGARSAHMRILYPGLVFGAIASSAVTHATVEYWEYFDMLRRSADPKCVAHIEATIQTVDILLGRPPLNKVVKSLFGLAELESDADFASLLEYPLGYWQARNWDPEVGSTEFERFCEGLEKPISSLDVVSLGSLGDFDESTQTFNSPGDIEFGLTVLKYAKYIREHVVSQCPDDQTVEECFGTSDVAKYQKTDLSQTWRLWSFQVCTEWGYFMNAPPEPLPRIISRYITLEYESSICRHAFPPGKSFTVPSWPNVTVVNEIGDFDIAADRLALVDGELDPWRPASPHSDYYAIDREDTILRPFKLIPNAVHHWDENGLRNRSLEPSNIKKVHEETVEFVLEWLKDFKKEETVMPR